jgi:hypothetical protein
LTNFPPQEVSPTFVTFPPNGARAGTVLPLQSSGVPLIITFLGKSIEKKAVGHFEISVFL